ncbi:MAG TPA: hypothetical protein PKK43_16435, partial [Spirochaetota bacterium]|nr:hypothetical protein [Spirochaetota bacterium]
MPDPKALGDAAKEGKKASETLDEFQDKQPKKKKKTYKIALIPFDYSLEVGQEKATAANKALASTFISRKSFEPSSMRIWLNDNFGARAAENNDEIIDRAKSAAIPVDFICHGKIYKMGGDFVISVAVYHLAQTILPTYYYRSFASFNSLSDALTEIVSEMEVRCDSPDKSLFKKSIYVKKPTVTMYSYSKLDNNKNEVSYVSIPFIKQGG